MSPALFLELHKYPRRSKLSTPSLSTTLSLRRFEMTVVRPYVCLFLFPATCYQESARSCSSLRTSKDTKCTTCRHQHHNFSISNLAVSPIKYRSKQLCCAQISSSYMNARPSALSTSSQRHSSFFLIDINLSMNHYMSSSASGKRS
jgi:hypothetical protein